MKVYSLDEWYKILMIFKFDIPPLIANYFLLNTTPAITSIFSNRIPSYSNLIDETTMLNTINLMVLDYMNKGFFRLNSNNTVVMNFKDVKTFRYSSTTNRYHPSLTYLEILKKAKTFKFFKVSSDIFESSDLRSLDKMVWACLLQHGMETAPTISLKYITQSDKVFTELYYLYFVKPFKAELDSSIINSLFLFRDLMASFILKTNFRRNILYRYSFKYKQSLKRNLNNILANVLFKLSNYYKRLSYFVRYRYDYSYNDIEPDRRLGWGVIKREILLPWFYNYRGIEMAMIYFEETADFTAI